MVDTETTSADQAAVFWSSLAPNERQVGAVMAAGWANSEIANRLNWSIRAVEVRISAIYEKMPDISGVHRPIQAVLLTRRFLG